MVSPTWKRIHPIVKKHAGKLPTKEIAALCGLRPSTLTYHCSIHGASLRLDPEAAAKRDAEREKLSKYVSKPKPKLKSMASSTVNIDELWRVRNP